jgi:hypothetical protein
MIKIIAAAAVVAGLTSPAFAQPQQITPSNNGLSDLNSRGTIGDAPAYGLTGNLPPGCTRYDTRAECQQAAAPNEPNGASGIDQGSDPRKEPGSPGDLPRRGGNGKAEGG